VPIKNEVTVITLQKVYPKTYFQLAHILNTLKQSNLANIPGFTGHGLYVGSGTLKNAWDETVKCLEMEDMNQQK
jgi:hypothetical protein